MSIIVGNEVSFSVPIEVPDQAVAPRGLPIAKLKGCRNVRGLPLHQRKLFRNLARQTPRVQGLTFDHNQIRWISYWKNEQNKQVQKHFPVSRYGFFGARKLALEERNRVQGWPLDTDEAAVAIERLKLEVAAFQGKDDGSPPHGEEGHHQMETDEENTQALLATTESALMRSMREDDDEVFDRQSITGTVVRRRGTRQKAIKKGLNVSTQTDRRDNNSGRTGGDRERCEGGALLLPYTKQERAEVRALRDPSVYCELVSRAYALMAAQRADVITPTQEQQQPRKLPGVQQRQLKQEEFSDSIVSLTPSRTVGCVYLDGGSERQASGGSSRLVSMASTSFEEGDILGDTTLSAAECTLQEPDPLRDLLNCVVSQPQDSGIDWDAECAMTSSANVDASRPTRNPLMHFHSRYM